MGMTPGYDEFKKLAGKGNLIPVSLEVVADLETPVSAYAKIAGATGGRGISFLLESVEGGESIGRYSMLACKPRAVFTQTGGKAVLRTGRRSETIEGRDVFERLAKVMSRFKPAPMPNLPPFVGGAVGYAAYDVISEIEPTVPKGAPAPPELPEALFMITDSMLVFDHVRHTIKIICQAHVESKSEKDLKKSYAEACATVRAMEAKLKRPLKLPAANLESSRDELSFESNKTPSQFHSMVRRAKEFIFDGDIIQTVLSQRFSAKAGCSPLALHRSLRMVNPSPYMFLLDCGDFAVVGASPEVHAKCEDGLITVRPIAGTRKRGATAGEDAALEAELLADPKECAEHIMLVDLARNDVGRVSEPGSVKVDKLMIVERYSHVMHIVSNVTGRLSPSFEADAVMRSTFPAGTLSGAPKVRAMQIITQLEKERRGAYGGAVAYWSFNGNINSCITIRTAVLKDGMAYVQSGAGIVADSIPKTEDEETRNKAKAMMKSLSLARLFDAPSKRKPKNKAKSD